jgi:hypothetical protein
LKLKPVAPPWVIVVVVAKKLKGTPNLLRRPPHDQNER